MMGWSGTGGIEVDQHFAMVWTLRDGRAPRMDTYGTREEALAAAGAASPGAKER
jgi:ketosteroid isomerase-like protein